jgi:hypothetical protein
MAAALAEGTGAASGEDTSAALVTPPWLARPRRTAINLPAIDLPSGTGIEAGSTETGLNGIGTDLAITGSFEIGLPFLAWAFLMSRSWP